MIPRISLIPPALPDMDKAGAAAPAAAGAAAGAAAAGVFGLSFNCIDFSPSLFAILLTRARRQPAEPLRPA